MFCPSCGTELPEEAKFCGKCGTPKPEAKQVVSVKVQASTLSDEITEKENSSDCRDDGSSQELQETYEQPHKNPKRTILTSLGIVAILIALFFGWRAWIYFDQERKFQAYLAQEQARKAESELAPMPSITDDLAESDSTETITAPQFDASILVGTYINEESLYSEEWTRELLMVEMLSPETITFHCQSYRIVVFSHVMPTSEISTNPFTFETDDFSITITYYDGSQSTEYGVPCIHIATTDGYFNTGFIHESFLSD